MVSPGVILNSSYKYVPLLFHQKICTRGRVLLLKTISRGASPCEVTLYWMESLMLLRWMWIFLNLENDFWWNPSNAQDLGHAVLLLLLLVAICKWREEPLKIKWAHKFEVPLCVKTSHLRTGYSRSTTGLPLIGQTTFSTEYIESVKSTSFSSSSSSSCFPDFRQQNCSCCNIEKRNCKYEMVMIICVFHKPQNC